MSEADKPKAFVTFKRDGVRYLAFPNGRAWHIVDDAGNNYGSWSYIVNFDPKAYQPLGKMRISGVCLQD